MKVEQRIKDEAARLLGELAGWSARDEAAEALAGIVINYVDADLNTMSVALASAEHRGASTRALELLADMVKIFEEETSAGDGVSETHWGRYQAAKAFLKAANPELPDEPKETK